MIELTLLELRTRTRDELERIAAAACEGLIQIANNVTSDEGDAEATENEFGLDVSEIVEMAHDNMINAARNVLKALARQFPPKEKG